MSQLRYGVIGLNGIGRYHLRFARENPHVEVTAVVDVDEGLARTVAAECGARAFTDYRDMLDAGVVETMAEMEGLDAHRLAVSRRLAS